MSQGKPKNMVNGFESFNSQRVCKSLVTNLVTFRYSHQSLLLETNLILTRIGDFGFLLQRKHYWFNL